MSVRNNRRKVEKKDKLPLEDGETGNQRGRLAKAGNQTRTTLDSCTPKSNKRSIEEKNNRRHKGPIICTREPLHGHDVDWIVSKDNVLVGSIGRGKNMKKYPYNKEFEYDG